MPHGPSPEQMLMRAVGINPAGNPARQSDTSLPLDLDAMAKLLSSGVRPDACRDRSGTTALGVAAYLGRVDAMKLLLEYGADVEAENLDGAGPLTMAVFGKSAGAVAMCLVYGGEEIDEETIAEARSNASQWGAQECIDVIDAWNDHEEMPELEDAEEMHVESLKVMAAKAPAPQEDGVDWKARCLAAETRLARAEEQIAEAEKRAINAEERIANLEAAAAQLRRSKEHHEHHQLHLPHLHMPKMMQHLFGGHHTPRENGSHRSSTQHVRGSLAQRTSNKSGEGSPTHGQRKHQSIFFGRFSMGQRGSIRGGRSSPETIATAKSTHNVLHDVLKQEVGRKSSSTTHSPLPALFSRKSQSANGLIGPMVPQPQKQLTFEV